ncbi:MAG: hypothetical protein IPG02_16500 [Ignavibacteria bacterium]|nr:hypothetical protein [Ignavibacteria bacterium]
MKFEETIAQTMYRSSEQSLGDANATYNLDGYLYSSFDNAPQLYFRNDAKVCCIANISHPFLR